MTGAAAPEAWLMLGWPMAATLVCSQVWFAGLGALPGAPAPGEVEEDGLLDKLRSRDPEAFERIVRAYGSRLLLVAKRFLRNEDDARDAVQDAFLNAFRSIDRFQGGARLSTWLHRIVVNSALMKIRGRSRSPEESIEDLLPRFRENGHQVSPSVEWATSAAEDSHAAIERSERRTLVRRCIDELPETYRTVLLLRDIEEMETTEVAVMLGVTENAVKIRLHRARQALRTLLDPHLRRSTS